ncbi:HNH endonuclease signature motif containing protein [Luteipulveratus sp. YIM 133132]|uniref:HNH endonuclease signature motif containing protein n=1 Tax=Luteipulveratus flavus TaxID=3031728 RepID=A0ABT6C6H5_9MICO|nr:MULTISPECIES: HNH endonuclease signature motif containing protein [unclassified Luteipulveratus]MDE9364103.1 HNH endonuclease signature motif containing protein [Luteipulveratus sp. YIM 133132]MDF8264321.1 HNH endonuclease signature motif containing protein [Luteipulveratus sp. YIM 133296]
MNRSTAQRLPGITKASGLPSHVAAWLDQLTGPPAAGGADLSPEATRAAAAALIAAAQGVQAWAEAAEIDAVQRLVGGIEDDLALDLGQHERRSTPQTRRALARTAAATELQLLTGSPLGQCRDRIALATATRERAGGLRARMAAGTVSAWRATTLLKETRHLDPLTAGAVAARVLAPLGWVGQPALDGSPADAWPGESGDELAAVLTQKPLSQSTFRRRLARQVALAESATVYGARRHREAVSARDVRTEPGRHGVAETAVTASRERAFAAQQRVTSIARSARAAGDPRTLAQLRSDIATDLLIRGQVPGDVLLADAPAAQLHVVVNLATLLPPAATSTSAAADGVAYNGADGDADDGAGSLSPALGTGVGEVPGVGFLSAAQVRAVACAQGSTWRRLVTDPITGAVIDAASTYRPPAPMRRLVQARDQRCRAPGCEHPAVECDLDHDTRWRPGAQNVADGATHPDNLHALHRAHHQAKTRGWWRSEQSDDGDVIWQTLTGSAITTRAANLHALEDLSAVAHSRMEVALAALIEDAADPAPLTAEMAAIRDAVTTRRTTHEDAPDEEPSDEKPSDERPDDPAPF